MYLQVAIKIKSHLVLDVLIGTCFQEKLCNVGVTVFRGNDERSVAVLHHERNERAKYIRVHHGRELDMKNREDSSIKECREQLGE